MDKRIFELAKMQTEYGVTVFVRCEKIRQCHDDTSVTSWLEYFGSMVTKAANEQEAAMYEHCSRLLLLAAEVSSSSKVWGLYNVPCVTGNEVMFIIQFDSKEVRDFFQERIEELETEFNK